MSETKNLVEVRDLVKRYGRTLAVDGISLDIARGERYAILGPNGAGKTTLIHVLCTIHRADSGTVTIGGDEVHKRPLQARKRLGVVFQESSLDTRLTVTENLEFHGRVFGVPRSVRKERIPQLLELVELSDWREHLVASLSKGMQRRLEIARALVHDAELLVLDEPTVGLDAQTRIRMWEHIAELQRQRVLTVLATTHYIEEVDSVDKVCIVDHGKVLAIGTPDALKSQFGRTVVRIVAADRASHERLVSSYPEADVLGEVITLEVGDDWKTQEFLGRHGADLRTFHIERATLEKVFLTLTGTGIRDQMASAQDGLLAFAQRGGEHTR